MTSLVIFYEKPACLSNSKQKFLLTSLGHDLVVRNLLSESWTAERLRPFFGDLPVRDWFNPTAPRIKGGEVCPERLDEPTALALMIADPLLIRRPLIETGVRAWLRFRARSAAGRAWRGTGAGSGSSVLFAERVWIPVANRPLRG